MSEPTNTETTDTEKLLAELESDEDTVPEEVRAVDAGDTGAQGKASHAFAEQKRKAREIAALARKQQQEIEELKKNQKPADTSPPPAPLPTAGSPTAKSILAALTNQAMQTLGLLTITTPEEQELVMIERNRLYSVAMNQREQSSRAEGSAPRVIEEKLAKFAQLDDVGRAEIKKRLGSYNVLQRTDDDVIRLEVTKYLGELTLAGQSGEAPEGVGGDSAPHVSPQERSSARAAASAASNGRPGPGVKPGAGSAPRSQPKPPTDVEAEEMRKLRVTDVVAYRAAKQRSSLYKGR